VTAYITSADWSLRHHRINNGADLGVGTFPTSAEFVEWLAWATGLVNTYLHTTTNVAEEGVTIKNVVDDLLWIKYLAETEAQMVSVGQAIDHFTVVPHVLDGTMWASQLDAMYANQAERPVARCYSLLTGRRVV
jgi:hypothetical protein